MILCGERDAMFKKSEQKKKKLGHIVLIYNKLLSHVLSWCYFRLLQKFSISVTQMLS